MHIKHYVALMKESKAIHKLFLSVNWKMAGQVKYLFGSMSMLVQILSTHVRVTIYVGSWHCNPSVCGTKLLSHGEPQVHGYEHTHAHTKNLLNPFILSYMCMSLWMISWYGIHIWGILIYLLSIVINCLHIF